MSRKPFSRTRTSPRVALIVESSTASGRNTLRGIAEYIRQTGHWSVYCEASHYQTVLPEWLHHWKGDGVIARIRNRNIAKALLKLHIPLVDIRGTVTSELGIPLVQVDNPAISMLAANHLIEHGFQSFAYCGVRGTSWSKQRQEAFREVVGKSGFPTSLFQMPLFNSKALFSESERSRVDQWISSLPKPVGIMAATDWTGQKLLESCRRIGVMAPEEVAVIGVDNDEVVCEISDPMLSSIEARHDRVGFHAAKLLDEMINGSPAPTEPMTVGVPSIVVRRSTDVQTIADLDVVSAVRFIRENACNGIHIEDVLAHVALSESTLNRKFQQTLSRSIHEEISRVRIERVKELLAKTEMTVTQIARATGFKHQEYLSVNFKRQTGMTPSAYRNETRDPNTL